MVLVETLLDRGADDDLDEAKSAIERLAALAGNAGAVDNVIVLRLWAQMARALGDEAAYRDYRDRYQAIATALGLEGHMKWAEAMPWQARSTATDRNRPQWRLAELRLREPVYDRAGSPM
jgi:adenylate cyclase